MKTFKVIRQIVSFTFLSAALAFLASSATEILLLDISLRTIDLHKVNAAPLQPYLFSFFIVLTIIFDLLFIKKFVLKNPKSLS